MIPLAFLAIIAGWFEHGFFEFITRKLPFWEGDLDHMTHYSLIAVTTLIAVSGIAFAFWKYLKAGGFSKSWEDTFVHKVLSNQYYIPHFYERFISKPYLRMSNYSWKTVDVKIIDKVVDSVALAFYNGGTKSKAMQNGNLSSSLRLMTFGIVLLLIITLAIIVYK
jgi:NADH-quinone oxidoreductase subunit L